MTTYTKPLTATERLQDALSEGAEFTIDHETKRFIALRFRVSYEPRSCVVRVHKSDPSGILRSVRIAQ